MKMRKAWKDKYVTCPFCEGTGEEIRYEDSEYKVDEEGNLTLELEDCRVCIGKGFLDEREVKVRGEVLHLMQPFLIKVDSDEYELVL